MSSTIKASNVCIAFSPSPFFVFGNTHEQMKQRPRKNSIQAHRRTGSEGVLLQRNDESMRSYLFQKDISYLQFYCDLFLFDNFV